MAKAKAKEKEKEEVTGKEGVDEKEELALRLQDTVDGLKKRDKESEGAKTAEEELEAKTEEKLRVDEPEPKMLDDVKVSVGKGADSKNLIIPTHQMFLPGEIKDYTMGLKNLSPEDLRMKHTQEHFENVAFKVWINQLLAQVEDAKQGGGGTIAGLGQPPIGSVKNGSREEDSGDTHAMERVAKTMAPWMMMNKMFSDDAGEGKHKKADGGTFKYKTEDGSEIEMPLNQMPLWMNPMMGGMGTKKDAEEKITIKDDEGRDMTMPLSFYPYYLMQRQGGGGNNKAENAMVKVRDMEGVEREVPASAVGALLDMERMISMRNHEDQQQSKGDKSGSETVTITDETGNVVTMPAAMYPVYLANQQMSNAKNEAAGKAAGESKGGSGLDATVIASLATLTDSMRVMKEEMNPASIGKRAVEGLMAQAEEFKALKAFLGGGDESDEVARERIRQAEETKRKELEENAKLQREMEKTRQSELEASKFNLMLGGGLAQPQGGPTEMNDDERKEVLARHNAETVDDLFDRSAEVNKDFMQRLREEAELRELEKASSEEKPQKKGKAKKEK